MQLELRPRSWGGRRDGAGRPRGTRTLVPHRPRPDHKAAHPVHVTLRARRDVPPLRERPQHAIEQALARASRAFFRVIHYSVQRDHVHLIVEANDRWSLSRGMHGLAIRLARAINRALRRRGSVFADHYHAHPLTRPREVRNALVYVIANWKKHMPGTPGIDPCSSGRWFDGWRGRRPDTLQPPVRAAATWLLRTGWRRYGPVDVRERPRAQFAFD